MPHGWIGRRKGQGIVVVAWMLQAPMSFADSPAPCWAWQVRPLSASSSGRPMSWSTAANSTVAMCAPSTRARCRALLSTRIVWSQSWQAGVLLRMPWTRSRRSGKVSRSRASMGWL